MCSNIKLELLAKFNRQHVFTTFDARIRNVECKNKNVLQGRIRDFFRRGCTRLLLYFNTNKPHSFFFCRIPVVLENRRSSQGEGGAHPCTLPLDPPLF